LERFVLKIPKDDKSALHKKSSILGMKKPLKEVILVILKDKYHSQICVFCQALVEEYQPFFKRKGFKFTK
jgi:hypothetical protein